MGIALFKEMIQLFNLEVSPLLVLGNEGFDIPAYQTIEACITLDPDLTEITAVQVLPE